MVNLKARLVTLGVGVSAIALNLGVNLVACDYYKTPASERAIEVNPTLVKSAIAVSHKGVYVSAVYAFIALLTVGSGLLIRYDDRRLENK